jgi:uncharacterized UBP type Zn finger protein
MSSADTKATQGWFSVQPKDSCPHCSSVAVPANAVIDVDAPCESCGNVGENMLCLTCFKTMCGRHVEGHMLAHCDALGHPMVAGYVDLTFWCYACDSYVSHRNQHLREVHSYLYMSKFEEQPPSSAAKM